LLENQGNARKAHDETGLAGPVRRMVAVALLAVLLAGCVSPGETPASPDSNGTPVEHQEAVEPAAPASTPTNETITASPAPLPTFASAGLSWSACSMRSGSFAYKHEWADDFVPSDYRQLNVVGNTGNFRMIAISCEAMSIGNLTFIPNAALVVFGVLVEAPEDVHGPGGNLFLLEAVTTSDRVAAAMAASSMPAHAGTFHADDTSYAFSVANGPAATITEPALAEAVGNETRDTRLHWVVSGQPCWLDVRELVERSGSGQAVFQGISGSPAVVTGPASHTAGLATRGTESGYMSAPRCQGLGN
jgi:hypothetical protein